MVYIERSQRPRVLSLGYDYFGSHAQHMMVDQATGGNVADCSTPYTLKRADVWKFLEEKVKEDEAQHIPERTFEIELGNEKRVWHAYRDPKTKLFVVADKIKEGYTPPKEYDGKTFAKDILPETPLLLVHWHPGKKAPAQLLPETEILAADYEERTFHAYFVSAETLHDGAPRRYENSGQKSFQQLIKTLIGKDMDVKLDEYLEIIGAQSPKGF